MTDDPLYVQFVVSIPMDGRAESELEPVVDEFESDLRDLLDKYRERRHLALRLDEA